MKTNRDKPTCSALFSMVDNQAAITAANRMYRSNSAGFRHCCDTRALLTTEQAMALDAINAARRGQPIEEPTDLLDESDCATQSSASDFADLSEDDDDLLDDVILEDERLIDLDDDIIIATDDEAIDVLLEDLAMAE